MRALALRRGTVVSLGGEIIDSIFVKIAACNSIFTKVVTLMIEGWKRN